MSDLEQLRKANEEANARAVKLSGDYQSKLDKQVTAKWHELKERYGGKIADANAEAAEAQKQLMDAEVIHELKAREDGEKLAWDLVRQGGLRRDAVEEAFPRSG